VNKKELSIALAKRSGLSQAKALEIVDHLFNPDEGIIVGELIGGRKLTLPGFGTFVRKVRQARMGSHPSTGDTIRIPERPYASFKAGSTLKSSLAEKGEVPDPVEGPGVSRFLK
jgi:DNA-binding protein HU-beta